MPITLHIGLQEPNFNRGLKTARGEASVENSNDIEDVGGSHRRRPSLSDVEREALFAPREMHTILVTRIAIPGYIMLAVERAVEGLELGRSKPANWWSRARDPEEQVLVPVSAQVAGFVRAASDGDR